LRSAANKFGAIYSKPGNGICHQLTLERFSRPGWVMLGADSHTPTAGGVGMLAIGVGGMDIAVALGGGLFYLPAPKVVRVLLSGQLPPWSSAKDVILEILRRLTVKGNVGTILEYAGEGVKTLSVPERGTICNMGTELGITTSIFPSDEVTRQFLRAQQREEDWQEISADADAAYSRTIEIDLSSIAPMAACPHSPGNVVPLKELAARGPIPVDQVLIGSCTNSSYRDLMTVARLLKGRKAAKNVELGIAPGSRQVLEMIAGNGALADILASGARILESACGFCMGVGMSPKTNAVSVRTNNRNFEGRSGTMTAQCYLVSPESAVAAALTGRLIDPSEANLSWQDIPLPETFPVDDSMFDYPDFTGEIVKGPNFGPAPQTPPPGDEIAGAAAIVLGDDVTTDHILPAGGLMKYRSNIPKYSEYVFSQIDPEFSARCHVIADSGRSPVIVGGLGYGQGSSREHAAICPMHLGVRAVIAKSMERIHRANLINFGILPLYFVRPEDHADIGAGDELAIAGVFALIDSGTGTVRNTTKGKDIPVSLPLSERQKDILKHGGLLRYTKARAGG
ncbi:MAG: aconitate hydratase, partial [Candidatus Accumulibacter sp.]|nr:aconitate hydratase [Accumulibacter sp.]